MIVGPGLSSADIRYAWSHGTAKGPAFWSVMRGVMLHECLTERRSA